MATALVINELAAAFNWNLETYKFDKGMQRGQQYQQMDMKLAQFSLFREDVRDLFSLTYSNLSTYMTVGTLFFSLGITFIYCGYKDLPMQISWLPVFYSNCVFGSITLALLSVWLSMHGTIAAHSRSVTAMTQYVRLPVPGSGEVQAAAKTQQDFEEGALWRLAGPTNPLTAWAADKLGWTTFQPRRGLDSDVPRIPSTSSMSRQCAKILNRKAKKRITRKQTREFGIKKIRQTITNPRPEFCHAWDGPDAESTGKQESLFGSSLRKAYSALQSLALPLPKNFHQYPEAVKDLRKYIFLQNRQATTTEFVQIVQQYVDVVQTREKSVKDDKKKFAEIAEFDLTEKNEGVWGSFRQWAFGELISSLLTHFKVTNNLHPAFAAMLVPCGGIAGPGNMSFFTGSMHKSITIHGIVHDAFGYVGRFHNVGPGYNYIGSNSLLSRFLSNYNPLSCQIEGIIQARIELKREGMLGDKGRQVVSRSTSAPAIMREGMLGDKGRQARGTKGTLVSRSISAIMRSAYP